MAVILPWKKKQKKEGKFGYIPDMIFSKNRRDASI
jgi:hypothetical protein